jgi:hypothetical protein
LIPASYLFVYLIVNINHLSNFLAILWLPPLLVTARAANVDLFVDLLAARVLLHATPAATWGFGLCGLIQNL